MTPREDIPISRKDIPKYKRMGYEIEWFPGVCPREDGSCCGRGPGDCPEDFYFAVKDIS